MFLADFSDYEYFRDKKTDKTVGTTWGNKRKKFSGTTEMMLKETLTKDQNKKQTIEDMQKGLKNLTKETPKSSAIVVSPNRKVKVGNKDLTKLGLKIGGGVLLTGAGLYGLKKYIDRRKKNK